MKTEKQVREMLKKHEMFIEVEFERETKSKGRLESLRQGRISMLWVLSDENEIKPDELTKKIDFEILVIESSKIF